MNYRYFTLCLVLSILLRYNEAFIGTWKLRQRIFDERDRQVAAAYGLHGLRENPVETFYLEQPLDHFNAMSKELNMTYRQKYMVNKQFWKSKESPVFLILTGEWTLSLAEVMSGEMVVQARVHGALILGLEHRFYGDSLNDNGLQLEQLQYLSSQQALADVATFIHHIKVKYEIPDTAAIITYGGSYAGALVAWLRLKYPHLVRGAVASSAPVEAITNFKGYNDVVAASLADPLVGGSQKCVQAISQAFEQVDAMVADDQFEELSLDFMTCVPLTGSRSQTALFLLTLAEYFKGIVQYNQRSNFFSIRQVCNAMLTSDKPYQDLVDFNLRYLLATRQKCMGTDYALMLSMLANSTFVRRKRGVDAMRQWIYQTCTQFGYYQSCDWNSSCPFSHHDQNNLWFDLDICQKIFNIRAQDVYANVDFSNDYYGARKAHRSNVIFVNGSIDPWHWLSVLKSRERAGEYAVFIQGTAHCADLGLRLNKDPQNLKDAREEIARLVTQFIEGSTKTE